MGVLKGGFNTANKCNGGVEIELEEREVETFQHS
jgi:hypothetical protein